MSRLPNWARERFSFIAGLVPIFSADALSPLNKVAEISVPKLFIVGAEDQHTTLRESEQMFAAAAEPKELWIVDRAKHTDLYAETKAEYEQRVLSFFNSRLR